MKIEKISQIKNAISKTTTVEHNLQIKTYIEAKYNEYKAIYQNIDKLDITKEHNQEIKDSLILLGELRLLNEAKLGELLKGIDLAGRGGGDTKPSNTEVTRLKDLGINKNQSSKAQKIFENMDLVNQVIEEAKKYEEPPTMKEVLGRIKERQRDTERKTYTDPKPFYGKYEVIYADPPWEYEHIVSKSRAIENQYPVMSLEDICALPVSRIAEDECMLFLWATSPKLEEAIRVINSWGFTYRTCAVWDKQVIGMGYYFRQQHELLLVAVRGKGMPPLPKNRPSSIFSSKRTVHSKKPELVYELIEKMYDNKHKIELFSRQNRKGWDSWGYESNT